MIINLDEKYPLNEETKRYQVICIDRRTGEIDETDNIISCNPDKVIDKQVELSSVNIIVQLKELKPWMNWNL